VPLTVSCCSKSKLVLPFWCWLTQVVPDKIQEGRRMVVCMCVCGERLCKKCQTCKLIRKDAMEEQ